MTRVAKATVGVMLGAVGAGAAVVRRLAGGAPSPAAGDRWHAVTVALLPEPGDAAPLTGVGDTVEVRVRPAPGGKGAEIHARLAAGAQATPDEVRDLRRSLRETKQRLETGEVQDNCVRAVFRPGD